GPRPDARAPGWLGPRTLRNRYSAAIGVPDIRPLSPLDEAGRAANRAEGAYRRIDAAGDGTHGAGKEFGVTGHGMTMRSMTGWSGRSRGIRNTGRRSAAPRLRCRRLRTARKPRRWRQRLPAPRVRHWPA